MIRIGSVVLGVSLLLAAVAMPLAASARSDHRDGHHHNAPRHGWQTPSHKDWRRLDEAYWKWHRAHVRVYGYAPPSCRNYGPPPHRPRW